MISGSFGAVYIVAYRVEFCWIFSSEKLQLEQIPVNKSSLLTSLIVYSVTYFTAKCGIIMYFNIFLTYTHSLQAALYVIFLLFLSYSLLHASTKLDPTQYRDAGDSFRGFCEIISLVVVTFYFSEEINQMCM